MIGALFCFGYWWSVVWLWPACPNICITHYFVVIYVMYAGAKYFDVKVLFYPVDRLMSLCEGHFTLLCYFWFPNEPFMEYTLLER